MRCEDKVYVSKDVQVIITIKEGSNFTAADIAALEVTLKLSDTVFKIFTLALNEITIVGDVITLIIGKTDITVAGDYHVIVDMTHNNGDMLGLTPCPDLITFYVQ